MASGTPSGDEDGDGTQKTVTGIAIDTENTKTEYVLGAELSVSLTVTYSDGTSEKVTTGYTSDYDKTKTGAQTVTITYGGQTTTLGVTVKGLKVTKVEKIADPAKTEFEWGTDIDLAGLKLKVTYDDGSETEETSGFTVTGYDKTDKTKVGAQTITVSYGTKADTEGASNSIQLAINVTNSVKSIAAALASGVTFTEGDTVAKENLVVELVKANGAKEETTAYDFAPTAALTTSDTKITVTPTGDYATLEAKEVAITVAALTFEHTYEISLKGATDADVTPWDKYPWSGIAAGAGNTATKTTVTDATGYLASGVKVLAGAAVIYDTRSGKEKLLFDKSATDATSLNALAFYGSQSLTALKGPFKIEVTYNATGTDKVARHLRFYRTDFAGGVNSLFNADNADVEYTQPSATSDTTISYVYAGTNDSIAGLQLYYGDGGDGLQAYISKIVIKTNTAIPADTYAATAVAFTNTGIEASDNTKTLTLSKAQAAAGYQLTTSLEPTYSTDKVTYSIKEEETHGISVTDGKVSVAADYTGNNTVTVVATARDGVTAELSVAVNAEIALESTSVVTVALATGSSASIYTTGKTTLTATLDKDYTNVASYEWYVGNSKQENATDATFEFSNETAGTYQITAKAVSSANVTTAASAAFTVTVTEPPITVTGGVATLNADSYEYYLSFANLSGNTGDNAWTATSATKGKESKGSASTNAGTTMFKTAIQPVDLKTELTETLKVTGVAQIDIYIFDSNRKRAFKITTKQGDSEAVTEQYYTYGEDGDAGDPFTKDGSDKASKAATSWDPDTITNGASDKGATAKQFCYSIALDASKEYEITLTGGQKSVYPIGVVLKKTADSN